MSVDFQTRFNMAHAELEKIKLKSSEHGITSSDILALKGYLFHEYGGIRTEALDVLKVVVKTARDAEHPSDFKARKNARFVLNLLDNNLRKEFERGLMHSYAPFYNVAPLPIMTSIVTGDVEFFSSMMKIKDYVTDSCTVCIDALGILAAESSLKIIMLFSEVDDHFVRMSVARALGSFKGKEVIETLVRMMNDETSGVQKYAIESFGRIGDPSAVDEIIKAMQKGKLFWIREGIIAANSVGDKCLFTREEKDRFRKVTEEISDSIYGKIMQNWFKRHRIDNSIKKSRKELTKMLRCPA